MATHVQRRPSKLRKARPSLPQPSLSFLPNDPPVLQNFPIDWFPPATSKKFTRRKSSSTLFARAARWKWRSSGDTSPPHILPPLEWSQYSEDGHSPSSSSSIHTPSASASEQGHQGLYIPALHTSPFTLSSSPQNSPTQSYSNLFSSFTVSESTCFLPTRPHLSRRDATQSVIVRGTRSSSIRRRWTFSISIADERVSDETLVQELERIRTADGTPCALSVSGVWGSDMDTSLSTDDGFEDMSNSTCSSAPPAWPWTSARVALLTVRELVRTERHYLTSLRLLFAPRGAATATPPPPLMIRYAQAIVGVGERLLSGFEADMTVAGVSTIFIRVVEGGGTICEEEGGDDEEVSAEKSMGCGEAAYVAWCGVVGEWFSGKVPNRRRRLSKVVRSNTTDGALTLPREEVNPVFDPMMKSHDRLSSMPDVDSKRRPPPAVRDLAILPTQRIMRYVLLFQDLLTHTPTDSSTYSLVSRALAVATKLAQKCDRAQANASFLLPQR